jgi:hypothetical protein
MKDSMGDRAMCATCEFYEHLPKRPELGACHAEPIKGQLMHVANQVSSQIEPMPFSFFPDVPPDNWCGKHKRDPEKQIPVSIVVQPGPASSLILPTNGRKL